MSDTLRTMTPHDLCEAFCDALADYHAHDEDVEGETTLDDTHPIYIRCGAIQVELERRLRKLAEIEAMGTEDITALLDRIGRD